MTLDLRLNPASFRRHINTSTDVRTGRQVDVDYWFYYIPTKNNHWYYPFSETKIRNLVSPHCPDTIPYHHPPFFTQQYKIQHLKPATKSE